MNLIHRLKLSRAWHAEYRRVYNELSSYTPHELATDLRLGPSDVDGVARDEDVIGLGLGIVGRFHQHDTTLFGVLFECSLATSPRMDLRLHHGNRTAQGLECGSSFIGGLRYDPLWNGHTGLGEQGFRLILVNLHGSLVIRETCCLWHS